MFKKRLTSGVGCALAIGAGVHVAQATVVSGSMGGYIYSRQVGTYDPSANPSDITYQQPTQPNTPATASFTYDTSTAVPTGGGHYQVLGSLTFGSLLSTGITSLDIEVRDNFFDSVNILWNDASGATLRSLYFSVVVDSASWSGTDLPTSFISLPGACGVASYGLYVSPPYAGTPTGTVLYEDDQLQLLDLVTVPSPSGLVVVGTACVWSVRRRRR